FAESQHRLSSLVEVPVVPCQLVVLAIRVVIALLIPIDFIASADHGDALRKKQRGEEIPFLPLAKLIDQQIVSRAFNAKIPRVVLVSSVTIAFSVCFVVLLVMADQVVKRKAVVRRYEVDAGGCSGEYSE